LIIGALLHQADRRALLRDSEYGRHTPGTGIGLNGIFYYLDPKKSRTFFPDIFAEMSRSYRIVTEFRIEELIGKGLTN
jgi:O-methyltransferase involved in polyketide biosynthesis